jgi:hypothetical protein
MNITDTASVLAFRRKTEVEVLTSIVYCWDSSQDSLVAIVTLLLVGRPRSLGRFPAGMRDFLFSYVKYRPFVRPKQLSV